MNNDGALYVDVTIQESENVDATVSDVVEVPGTGTGGTTDYNQLTHLPKINNVILKGNVELSELGAVSDMEFSEQIFEINRRLDNTVPRDAAVPAEIIDNMFSLKPEAVSDTETEENFVSFVDLSGLQKTVSNTLKLLDEKVVKEPGKGLSTNDFDNLAKEKLDSVDEGANKTIVDSELNAESTNPVQNAVVTQLSDNLREENNSKAPVNSPAFTGIPTAPTAVQGTKTSQIATTEFVHNALSNVLTQEFELIKVVTDLPEIGEPNKIYLVPTNEKVGNNKFNEFLWVNNAWEYVGTQALNLDGYIKTDDMVEITFAEIEQMFTESGGSNG